jgi:putative ABC transport system permease protein
VVGVVTSATWVVQPAPGDDQFDAVYMPYTTTQRLLNLSKLNDITVTAESSGDVSRLSREITKLLRSAAWHWRQRSGRLHDHHARQAKALTTGGLPPSVARAVAANVAELEKVTLEQLAADDGARQQDDDVAAGRGRGGVAAGRRIGIMNITLVVGHRAHRGDRPAMAVARAQGRDAPVPV